MRKYLAAALLAASPAMADVIARSGEDSVRLTQNPCQITEHQAFPTGIPEEFRAASAVVSKKLYVACWALRMDGQVFLIYDDGDAGLVPVSLFKQDGL
jgi:hypothetical protein